MRAIQTDELRGWYEKSGIAVDAAGFLRYANTAPLGIRLNIPSEGPKTAALAASLLSVEDDFYGATMWFTNFDFGTPRIERCALRILEQMRRGYGVTASLENAPAQLFRTDEA